MSLMTRAVTAFAVLSVAAIPVAALTIKNTSSKEISATVDNGNEEAVYKVPAGSSIDVTQDCSSGCAATGPWGYSRLVSQNDAIETDGASLVTADATPAAPASRALVPQNAVTEPAEAAATQPPVAATPAPTAPRKRYVKPRNANKQAAKKGPNAGTLQMLFQGPGK